MKKMANTINQLAKDKEAEFEKIEKQIETLKIRCPEELFIVKLFKPENSYYCFSIDEARDVLENFIQLTYEENGKQNPYIVWDGRQPEGFFDSIVCLNEENKAHCYNSIKKHDEEEYDEEITKSEIEIIDLQLEKNKRESYFVTKKGEPRYEYTKVILLSVDEKGMIQGLITCIGVIIKNELTKERLGCHFVTGSDRKEIYKKEAEDEMKKLSFMNDIIILKDDWQKENCTLYLYHNYSKVKKEVEAIEWSLRNIKQVLKFPEENIRIIPTPSEIDEI